jgi:hypothetical protein
MGILLDLHGLYNFLASIKNRVSKGFTYYKQNIETDFFIFFGSPAKCTMIRGRLFIYDFRLDLSDYILLLSKQRFLDNLKSVIIV